MGVEGVVSYALSVGPGFVIDEDASSDETTAFVPV